MTTRPDSDDPRWVDGNLESGADSQPTPGDDQRERKVVRAEPSGDEGTTFEPEEDPGALD